MVSGPRQCSPLLSQHSSGLHGELAGRQAPTADMPRGQARPRHSLSRSIFQASSQTPPPWSKSLGPKPAGLTPAQWTAASQTPAAPGLPDLKACSGQEEGSGIWAGVCLFQSDCLVNCKVLCTLRCGQSCCLQLSSPISVVTYLPINHPCISLRIYKDVSCSSRFFSFFLSSFSHTQKV